MKQTLQYTTRSIFDEIMINFMNEASNEINKKVLERLENQQIISK